MSKKELPCPHCGQDIHIPARYNAESIAQLEAEIERLRRGILDVVQHPDYLKRVIRQKLNALLTEEQDDE